MTKPEMSYFSQEDILHLRIVNASAFVRDAILEGVQARVLNLVLRRRHSRMRGC